ncbi:hypothetical protein GCM10010168_86020 [Actinoplanes ianthinogenes]|uniref:IPT/TIG domain-containing protein n=1 Tax=Actinoplanes ianthinogenes TaxID=122358 RepID=A0ABN6CK16_9ACTN|nr:hypothetical protein Aiant_59900 [Actinoplanes ianthinogenes]GGR53837.1 hypothetical protein GCM10010168_86020 [Actinoplanes ianthinogenes]
MTDDQFTVTVATPRSGAETRGGTVKVNGANFFSVDEGHLKVTYGTSGVLAIFAPGQWVSATREGSTE